MTIKVTPSSATCETWSWLMSMNCGMNAPKNTSTLGLLSSTKNPCRKNPPRGGGGGSSALTPSTGRADQLDAEPDQIGRAGKPHPVEPIAHGRHQRGQPDRDDADHDREPGLHAGDVDQRRAGAMAQPVGDQQRDDRPRQQRQRDAGGDKGEIELEGTWGTRCEWNRIGRIDYAASFHTGEAACFPSPLVGEGGTDAKHHGRVRGRSIADRSPLTVRALRRATLSHKGRREEGRLNRHPSPRSSSASCRCDAEKLQRRALDVARAALALRHRNQQVAAVRHRDADGGMPRAVGHPQIVGCASGRTCRRPESRSPGAQRHERSAHHIEIGDAVDLIVIGDTGIAIAEADLRPHVDLDLIAARVRVRSGRRGPRASRRAETARRFRASRHSTPPPCGRSF